MKSPVAKKRVGKSVRKSPQAKKSRSGSGYDCPRGYTWRKGYYRKPYTRSDGVKVEGSRVKGACIKKQGSTQPRTKVRQSPKPKRVRQLKKPDCKPNEIVREGYVRKAYTRKDGTKVRGSVVPPTCVKDVGKKGKGKTLIQKDYKLRKGALRSLGYEVKDPEKRRRAALVKAIKQGKVPVNSLKWKLNAQYVYRKNAPKGSARYKLGQRFRKDFEYLRSLYPPKSAQKKVQKVAKKQGQAQRIKRKSPQAKRTVAKKQGQAQRIKRKSPQAGRAR